MSTSTWSRLDTTGFATGVTTGTGGGSGSGGLVEVGTHRHRINLPSRTRHAATVLPDTDHHCQQEGPHSAIMVVTGGQQPPMYLGGSPRAGDGCDAMFICFGFSDCPSSASTSMADTYTCATSSAALAERHSTAHTRAQVAAASVIGATPLDLGVGAWRTSINDGCTSGSSEDESDDDGENGTVVTLDPPTRRRKPRRNSRRDAEDAEDKMQSEEASLLGHLDHDTPHDEAQTGGVSHEEELASAIAQLEAMLSITNFGRDD